MSRAFVREPDAAQPRCPQPAGCGGLGEPVAAVTLRANLDDSVAATLTSEAYFCPDPGCDVAYFDAVGGRVGVDQLRERRWPKDGDAPLCACFGVHEATITGWGRDGRTDLMRAFLATAATPEARCLTRTHAGQSCVRNARRAFMSERDAP